MEGDAETGVSTMLTEAGFDTGPVYLAGSEPIRADDTYGTLAARLEQLGADLLIRTLDERPARVQQSEEGVTYAAKIGPDDRTLDPEATAAVNDRKVRALTPHIGARVVLAGRRVPRRPARRAARPRRDRPAARRGRPPVPRRPRAARGQARGRPPDGRRRLPARPRPI